MALVRVLAVHLHRAQTDDVPLVVGQVGLLTGCRIILTNKDAALFAGQRVQGVRAPVTGDRVVAAGTVRGELSARCVVVAGTDHQVFAGYIRLRRVHIRMEEERRCAPLGTSQLIAHVVVRRSRHSAKSGERAHGTLSSAFLDTHLERLHIEFTDCLLGYPCKQVFGVTVGFLVIQEHVL